MFCWLVPWRYRMFQMLWLDYNYNRRVIGTRVVWTWQGSNPDNQSTHHVHFHFLEENWKYQMPVRTEDFDKAIGEVIGTFSGVEEMWEGIVDYYLKERHIWRSCRPAIENHCCSSQYLAYEMSKYGISRQHKTFTSFQNVVCSNEFFFSSG